MWEEEKKHGKRNQVRKSDLSQKRLGQTSNNSTYKDVNSGQLFKARGAPGVRYQSNPTKNGLKVKDQQSEGLGASTSQRSLKNATYNQASSKDENSQYYSSANKYASNQSGGGNKKRKYVKKSVAGVSDKSAKDQKNFDIGMRHL